MILKAWLDPWLSTSRIFHLKKKNGLGIKNLLIRLGDISLLFLDLYQAKNDASKV